MVSIEKQAELFAALSDPTRLRLFCLLAAQSAPGALCVNALAGRLGVSQSAVSQHLKVLRAAGLVSGRRCGYRVHYWVNSRVLEQFSLFLKSMSSVKVKGSEKEKQKEKKNVS